jgi:hypothetical protein
MAAEAEALLPAPLAALLRKLRSLSLLRTPPLPPSRLEQSLLRLPLALAEL